MADFSSHRRSSSAKCAEGGVVPVGAPPRLPQSHRSARVLIVDDDFDARCALEEYLSAYGYETSVAKDGEEALAILSGGIALDFIVLDLMMPRMSGFDFLKAKRGLPEPLKSVPVAVASAIGAPFVNDVVAVFRKPTPILDLLSTIDKFARSSTPRGGQTAS